MSEKERKKQPVSFDDLFFTDKIKKNEPVVIIMSDNEVIHQHIKWFTPEFIGTQDGKMITRHFIKIIS